MIDANIINVDLSVCVFCAFSFNETLLCARKSQFDHFQLIILNNGTKEWLHNVIHFLNTYLSPLKCFERARALIRLIRHSLLCHFPRFLHFSFMLSYRSICSAIFNEQIVTRVSHTFFAFKKNDMLFTINAGDSYTL